MAPFLNSTPAATEGWSSLQDLFRHAAKSTGSRRLIMYPLGNTITPLEIDYRTLYTHAEENSRVISSLKGFKEGSPILLHLENHQDMILWFWATLLANGVPVPSPPLSNDRDHRRRHIEALSRLLESPICITRAANIDALKNNGSLQLYSVEALIESITSPNVQQLPIPRNHSGNSSLAMLMLTSGSTGDAKAVKLSHAQVLAAISGKASVRNLPRDKPLLNWIGLDHVASLVEIHLQALFLGVDQVHVHTSDVVSSPRTFLDLLSLHQVCRSFAPNFFLSKLIAAIESESREVDRFEWDFRNLVDIVSGGEANDIHTCKAVAELLAENGGPRNGITVGFGMTETCAGAIYNTRAAQDDATEDRSFASMGKCMKGIEMRITRPAQDDSASDVPLSAGEIGSLEIRGDVVFNGYYRNEKATAEAFTEDGWFRTGDSGVIDSAGNLHLVGRTKEVININGIKLAAAEIQASIETAVGSRVLRVVSFASRMGHTEQVAVAYVAREWPIALNDVIEINSAVIEACILSTGSRPLVFGLPDETSLPKSTLGKISRAKIRSLLEKGAFAELIEQHQSSVAKYQLQNFSLPTSEAEALLIDDFAAVLDIKRENIGTTTPVYDLGFSSIDLIRLKRKIDLRLNMDIPLMVFMKSPTAQLLATAIKELDPSSKPHDSAAASKSYDPVVVFRPTGSKTPLWCIHPGVGEVLIFVGLSNHMVDDDRPVFALRARGFDEGQPGFESIPEAVNTYKAAILQRQPHGPYAIAGYSYGGMLAFEIAKLLEQEGASVAFVASFNLPPHIKSRMSYLNFNVCLLHLSYFLGMVSEEYADSVEEMFRGLPDAMSQLLKVADKRRMAELGLDAGSLSHWAEVTYGLQRMAQDYDPKGKVKALDVFHAIPLKAAAKSKEVIP